jgi:hypothetical protein
MIGDLLNGSRSVSFGYIRASSQINVQGVGSTSITNPKVAENNSPIPQDRASFSYNFFSNALSVTGFGNPVVGLPGTPMGVSTSPPVRRQYDLHEYTFTGEKTFLDGFASVEVRVPFQTSLASKLDLRAGQVTTTMFDPMVPGYTFKINDTPQNSFGHEDTEFGDTTVIFKALLYRDCRSAFSGGFSVGIPTQQDTRVQVLDFGGPGNAGATNARTRVFDIENEIWSINPFVAVLLSPNDRLFVQGFLEFDFPLNKADVRFRDTAVRATATGFVPTTFPESPLYPGFAYPPDTHSPPFEVHTKIREQILMHADVGMGYWLWRNCEGLLTGIAPTVELHYTTTLESAAVIGLPGDRSTVINPADPNNPARLQIPEPRPTVGNLRNHMDIIDITLGTTFQLGERTTLATGIALPLNGKDRVFDWEAQVQLNYYFGYRGTRAPTFQ